MDDADRAGPNIDNMIADGIAKSRLEIGTNNLTACGVCLWCESPVSAGRVFCSPECHHDYMHDAQRRRDTGK
jgi:hypothetical protein